jgi:hypothetical protein
MTDEEKGAPSLAQPAKAPAHTRVNRVTWRGQLIWEPGDSVETAMRRVDAVGTKPSWGADDAGR